MYLAIPLVAAFVGYVTKTLAVEMIFRPIKFVGIEPWLGWQGILPRKALKIATHSADLMASRLLDSNELFERLDPERMLRELERPVNDAAEALVREIGETYMAGFWGRLPAFAQRKLVERLQAEIPLVMREFWSTATGHFEEYFDIRRVIIANLVRDKEKLNDIFWRVGGPELTFFRNIGFWFGFVLGVVQLACWMTWHEPLLMPLFGGLIGFVSDWVALQILFRPLRPKKILGWTFQGKFLARQDQVSKDYATLMASELLTPANLIEELLRGPALDRIVDLVHRQVREAMDARLGIALPLVVLALGHESYGEIRKLVARRIIDLIPVASREVEKYAMDALDINDTILGRMNSLSPEEFESVLRPAFKENEIIIVVAGAVLGALVGELQVFFMLGGH
ncbi:DUF445 domain-containing protein [Nevskia sp.]|uniref:DUF445 domain-containing protein n=1 Tax=Nevskia sp. TaxID=1929292 RepID=UPI0025F2B08A|nr:DUF445 domain-containing protein [Nevskia sp.]